MVQECKRVHVAYGAYKLGRVGSMPIHHATYHLENVPFLLRLGITSESHAMYLTRSLHYKVPAISILACRA